MANSKLSGGNYRKAIIDTAPGADGYWTAGVSPRGKSTDRLFMSIAEEGDSDTFTATVTLQFKAPGDSEWQVYATYTEATREIIEDSGATQWRIGVDNGDYTSGTVSVTIDW